MSLTWASPGLSQECVHSGMLPEAVECHAFRLKRRPETDGSSEGCLCPGHEWTLCMNIAFLSIDAWCHVVPLWPSIVGRSGRPMAMLGG